MSSFRIQKVLSTYYVPGTEPQKPLGGSFFFSFVFQLTAQTRFGNALVLRHAPFQMLRMD